ncbi:hypothetical protein BDZ45DRAFT_693693 [Acephala macrosclerotiorum]|nr:hypothetical protein BDZ45DRAFT_693693 [Acephala macrosclerotiorum]
MATHDRDEKSLTLAQHELGDLKASLETATDGTVPEGSEVMAVETKHQTQECEAVPKSHNKSFQQSITPPKAPSFTTFHPFPRLPIELRLRIWCLVLPQSALVQIEACWSNDPEEEVFFSLIRSPGNHNIRRTRKNGLLRTQRLRLGDIDTIHIENIPALRSINHWWDVCVKQDWVRIVKALRLTVWELYRMDWVTFFDTFASLEKLDIVSKRRIDSDRLTWLEKEKGKILEAKRDSVLLGVEGIDYNGDTARIDASED